MAVDILTGGTASADSEYGGSNVAAYACDNDGGTRWLTTNTSFPHYWKYDLGAGVSKKVVTLTITPENRRVKDFTLQGSNNDSDWDTLLTGQHGDNGNLETFAITSPGLYRYYKINMTNNWESTNYASIVETQMFELGAGNFGIII